jgi:hypothetical protein
MTVETKSAFDAFLTEIDGLQKAMPDPADYEESEEDKEEDAEGDAKIKQAAEAGKGKQPMAKSMQITLADGSVVDAVDGGEMIKALQDEVSTLGGDMAKAMGVTLDLLKQQGAVLAAQDGMIKSLTAKVASLSNAPAGRKSALMVHEKPAGTMAKAQPEGLSVQEFMAKADAAFAAGKITSREMISIDSRVRGNAAPDPALVAKVLG